MSIREILQSYTPPAVRARGSRYFRDGRVAPVHSDKALRMEGRVAGSEEYEVWLELVRRQGEHLLEGFCSCPFFEENEVCKHLWAFALFVDRNGDVQLPVGVYYEPYRGEVMEIYVAPPSPKKIRVAPRAEPARQAAARPRPPEPPVWEKAIREFQRETTAVAPRSLRALEDARSVELELRYELTVPRYGVPGATRIAVSMRQRLKSGAWGQWKDWDEAKSPGNLDEDEFFLATAVANLDRNVRYGNEAVSADHGDRLLPRLCATGRLFGMTGKGEIGPLAWDADGPWELTLKFDRPEEEGQPVKVRTLLRRGEASIPVSQLQLLFDLWGIWENCIHPLALRKADLAWLRRMRDVPEIEVPARDVPRFFSQLLVSNELPQLQFPEGGFDEVREAPAPVPVLRVLSPTLRDRPWFPARLLFRYADAEIPSTPWRSAFLAPDESVTYLRDAKKETAAHQRLLDLGAKPPSMFERGDCQFVIPAGRLTDLLNTLLPEGWSVTAEDKLYRPAGAVSMSVRSGIDWFDLEAKVDFGGGVQASMPELLRAVREKRAWVELGDGSYGMLPESWLQKWGSVLALGKEDKESVRFTLAQTGLLDAWLADQPEINVDTAFATARDRLRSFASVPPEKAPSGFVGVLRPYQEEGLGWLYFLREFRLGGCLADDMGLGKTVQVLALLEGRRAARRKEKLPPSLVVAPRSLIFNWLREAAQFTPKLRTLDYTGGERELAKGWDKKVDLVLTTYGTLRRDIGILKEIEFDYAILDESQAIKNAAAQTSKASRLLKASHRLAMSGTPLENHLGELWSLMDFLNPGLLGAASKFSKGWNKDAIPEQRAALGKALRPFLLRRTKAQVATDLPERQEDTLFCELPEKQRRHYDEVRDFYRQRLLGGGAKKGNGVGDKIIVLEALLRLRQAACHVGLLDAKKRKEPSAKFDALLPRLEALAEEGHKALVFSQFTSLLDLLKPALKKLNLSYEYLDGNTRDREGCVDRFQQDPSIGLFLISLKAGGHGLNLTAAEYVFLLDPWWNPAVEAQAIDRAHRIGQTRKVMAYRLIAADTVEDKVLALQQQKKALADAILRADNAVLRDLTRDDLELLLS